MDRAHEIEANMTVQRLLDQWPRTMRVFLTYRMSCVGCPVAGFETIAEVAQVYGHDPAAFLRDLRRCASGPRPPCLDEHPGTEAWATREKDEHEH